MADCTVCGGTGLIERTDKKGLWLSERCACQETEDREKRLAAAKIPARYVHCTIESFESAYPGAGASLKQAATMARRYIEDFPVNTHGKGLLFNGPTGAGKTHLSVAVMRALIEQRGARALFVDWQELVEALRQAVNKGRNVDELLGPAMRVEVLLIDDLGAGRPTEWTLELAGTLIGARYNRCLTTLATTNFSDREPDEGKRPATEIPLAERIGARACSRLAEMCLRAEMAPGRDFRRTVKKARLG